jgi:hypothetical protein
MIPMLMPFKRPLEVRFKDGVHRWYVGAFWWKDPSKQWLSQLARLLPEGRETEFDAPLGEDRRT